MKIAIPSKEQNGAHVVDAHFGHCEFFTVFTVNDETKEIEVQEHFLPPKGCGCKSNLAPSLAEDGVSILLAGNMGQGAVDVLDRVGVKAVRGFSGSVREAAEKWLLGEYVEPTEICHHHDGEDDECGHHHHDVNKFEGLKPL